MTFHDVSWFNICIKDSENAMLSIVTRQGATFIKFNHKRQEVY